MKKFREVRESDIESIKLVMNSYEHKEKLITMQCAKYILSDLFMSEFREHVTPEAFSTSPLLTADLINAYPDYFNIKAWIKHKDKSLQPLLDKAFVKEYGKGIVDDAIYSSNVDSITKEVFDMYFKRLNKKTKIKVVNESKLATDKEFIIEHAEYLNEGIFSNLKLNIKWDTDLIKKILENKRLTVKFTLSALYTLKDFSFIQKSLQGENLTFEKSGGTYDVLLKNFINKLPDSYLIDLFELVYTYNKSALTYSVLDYMLRMRDELPEKLLMDYLNVFLEAGLEVALAKYARFRDYRALELVLDLQ